jgi:hypothetical protein
MRRRLIFLGLGSAVLAISLVFHRHLAFPDIVPLPDNDPQQSTWRFDIAYIVTTLSWLAAVMAAFSTVGLLGLLWANRSAHS